MFRMFFAACVLGIASLHAGTVGTVTVCYACGSFAGVNNTDWVAFEFTNLTGTDITNAVIQIQVGGDNGTADSFSIGTIAASSSVFVTPGLSNDGNAGHSFFLFTGSGRDTSDVGPNSDSVPFEVTGLWGGTPVDTGVFTPAATGGLSDDHLQTDVNFLGGPSGDPCNVCFGPEVVADINTPTVSGVPEPSSLLWLLPGLGMILALRVRRAA